MTLDLTIEEINFIIQVLGNMPIPNWLIKMVGAKRHPMAHLTWQSMKRI